MSISTDLEVIICEFVCENVPPPPPPKQRSRRKNTINLKFLYELEANGKKSVIDWCIENGFVTNRYECPKCAGAMALSKRPNVSDGYAWVCHKRTKENPHDLSRSVRSGSLFSDSRLAITEILKIIYLWLNKCSNDFIMTELRKESCTVNEWKKMCREICVKLCLQETVKLGGPNKIVELDNGQFNNRKFNKRNKIDDGNWVFAGVERGSNQFFVVIVEQNNSETLFEIIKEYIEPGTIIMSNFWTNYNCLEQDNFRYLSIVNSLKFEQSAMNICIWNSIKGHLKRTKHTKGQFDSYLGEHLWRRAHNKDDDCFLTFLKAVSTIYVPKTKD